MDVSYSLTREDFANFVRYMQGQTPAPRPRSFIRRIAFFVLPILVVAVPLEGYASQSVAHAGVTVVVALVAALVLGVPGYWFDGRRGKVKAMTLPSDLSPLIGNHRATVSKDGLRDRSNRYDANVSWREVTQITQDDAYLYFKMGRKNAGFFIPKRDFPAAGRATAFFDEAMEFWVESRAVRGNSLPSR